MALDNPMSPDLMVTAIKLLAVGVVIWLVIELRQRKGRKGRRRYGR
jgi:hypothetical protein